LISKNESMKHFTFAIVLPMIIVSSSCNYSEKNRKSESDHSSSSIFPKGEKITNNNFIGNAWLQQLVATDSSNNIQVGSVTFEAGARTNWHLHPGGQILLATGGLGYYQEEGIPPRILRKGDVVKCPPNVQHWHGASRDQEFIQIAITNTQNGPTVWMQPVTDEQYNSIK